MAVGFYILLCALVSRFLDGRWLSAPLVLCGSLLGPLLVFSMPIAPFTVMLLVLAAACFGVSYFVVTILGAQRLQTPQYSGKPKIPLRELAFVSGLLFTIGQIAFAMNLLRVLSELGLSAYAIASAKSIELTFGASSFVNYLFFLNIPAACIGAYLIASGRTTWRLVLLVLCAIISLGFTGIKSTMIFGSCMVLLVYVLVKRPRIAWIAFAGIAMAVITFALFIGVNIGPAALLELSTDATLADRVLLIARGYVFNNYINLDLEFSQRDSYAYGKYTFFFISKLLDPNLIGYYDADDLLVVDQGFNMGTFVREYFVDFGVPGALLIPLILGALTGSVSNAWKYKRMPRHAITLAVLLTACLFAFFGNQFVRLQFLYVIGVAYGADLLASVLSMRRYEEPRLLNPNCRLHPCAE